MKRVNKYVDFNNLTIVPTYDIYYTSPDMVISKYIQRRLLVLDTYENDYKNPLPTRVNKLNNFIIDIVTYDIYFINDTLKFTKNLGKRILRINDYITKRIRKFPTRIINICKSVLENQFD